ncbi:histidine kinase [Candidatus Gottesmanbacteria bacterium CG11_big_fil_rev_8_21_14_0_20_37_11]|uniref:Histidine kinase n=2 Tax=Candidatus Gottesmaniibacteriota TaxID=1752720 RepID=A0A2M7RT43_9BACT|nr:MAG: histidine kinase [Candidatus Gottesmanbacteria bacterium CG11_big_fil_rev_8_21_14_0_20_37_11]PIZ03255.1 MAG: histidine kinase [Candidatus Gottesmanbacteria bacterium CG_4_10_14_0_8_um_filter_37_24]
MIKPTEVILKFALKKNSITTAEIAQKLGDISRQAANRHLRNLVKKGLLVKRGHTIGSYYILAKKAALLPSDKVKTRLLRQDLEEHKVFTALRDQAPFIRELKDNVNSILFYAFSEMLNNAIEHSKSKWVEVEINRDTINLRFIISDFGIGVFRNVLHTRHLKSELEAIQDLLKGKTTTAPHSHSGEGIFFTSKVADIFILDSFGFRLRVDNLINDVFIEKPENINRGTRVEFSITLDSKRHLNDVFSRFVVDPKEPGFNKTEIKVRLFVVGSVYISRSQARRILSGLEKYESIVFDFDKVTTVGQAFADEIFRVFKNSHPKIHLEAINMVEPVKFMVDRALEVL